MGFIFLQQIIISRIDYVIYAKIALLKIDGKTRNSMNVSDPNSKFKTTSKNPLFFSGRVGGEDFLRKFLQPSLHFIREDMRNYKERIHSFSKGAAYKSKNCKYPSDLLF